MRNAAGSGPPAVDVDECATANGGCHVNATCTNTEGSRTCECNTGYTGDGVSCSAMRDCAAILAQTPTAASGLYTITPNGSTSVNTYCDMITAGGGWTQVYDQDFAQFGAIRGTSAWTDNRTSTACAYTTQTLGGYNL